MGGPPGLLEPPLCEDDIVTQFGCRCQGCRAVFFLFKVCGAGFHESGLRWKIRDHFCLFIWGATINLRAFMSDIGVAIVGTGGITLQNHLPALALCPDVKVVALCDADPTVLERARKASGVA